MVVRLPPESHAFRPLCKQNHACADNLRVPKAARSAQSGLGRVTLASHSRCLYDSRGKQVLNDLAGWKVDELAIDVCAIIATKSPQLS